MIFLILGDAGSGKDTVAKIMQTKLGKEKTAITHYAGYLKWMYTQFFDWDGVKTEKARFDLQKLGTDIIRETYSRDFWVDRVIEQIEIFRNDFEYFIIPDCRFVNEIEKMKEKFGSEKIITIRVIRPRYETELTKEQQQHSSENDLKKYMANFVLINDNLEETEKRVDWILEFAEKE